MKDRERPSWAIRIFGPLPFIFCSVGALLWFVNKFLLLLTGYSSNIVVIEKGAYYMLGVGLGLLALAYICIHEFWGGKPLTNKQSSVLTKIAIASVALTFLVPHLIHYIADDFFLGAKYSVCEAASHQWLFVRDIVYIRETIECTENVMQEITSN